MTDPYDDLEPVGDPDVPDWDDEYFDQVGDRLMFNYDLEKDRTVHGETYQLYGQLRMESEKQFFLPALNYGHHHAIEHIFAGRRDGITVADLEAWVGTAHEIAADWIEADEEHYSTEFTGVFVVPEVPPDVREFVDGFRDRTLLKLGYYGHYEVNLLVVAPAREQIVASEKADVQDAFRLWEPIEEEAPGLWTMITRRLQI